MNHRPEYHVAFDLTGTTAIFHPLIQSPLRIAHLTDLHVLPERMDAYPGQMAQFIRFQHDELGHPNAGVAAACEKVAAARPDMVLVGGDIVDFLDDQAISTATQLIDRTGVVAHYCVGNHERPWNGHIESCAPSETNSEVIRALRQGMRETEAIPLSQQPLEPFVRRLGLRVNPFTGRFDHSIVHEQMRIIVMDSSMGDLLPEQAEWAEAEVRDGLPFLILTHVPFPVLTLVPRIRIIAGERMLGHIHDDSACHAVMRLTNRPNFMGALAGHMHARSEDVLGNACQLLTQPAAYGGYRIIDLLPVCTAKVFTPTSVQLARRPQSARLMKLR